MFRTISIDPVLNGYSVMIKFPEGDQELVFNTLDALLAELREYYTDPQGAEEHYRNTINAQHIINTRTQRPISTTEYDIPYTGNGGLPTPDTWGSPIHFTTGGIEQAAETSSTEQRLIFTR